MGAQVKQLTIEIEVLGQKRLVSWEEHGGGTFVIEGVKTYAEVVEILRACGDVIELPGTNPELEAARDEVRSAVAKGEVPLAPPVTKPGFRTEHITLPAERPKDVAPAASASSVPTSSSSTSAAPATTGTPAKPAEDGAKSDGDLGVFANMTTFAAVVAEIRKRGHETYAAIFAFALNLQGIGDVCPPLDQLADPRDPAKSKARLEDRLKTHLTKLGIAV